jgi:tetratricopeptide (TPR) repeat protein
MEIKEALAEIKAGIKAAQFDEIEAKSWDMMAAHPDSVELLMALGEAAMQAVNFSRADYYFMKAKIKGAQRTEPLFALAQLSILIRDFSRARAYYADILKLEPAQVLAQLGIADTFDSAQLYMDATDSYSKVLSMNAKEVLEGDQYAILVYKAASSFTVLKEYDKGLQLINDYAPQGFEEMVELAKLKLFQGQGKEKLAEAKQCLNKLQQNVPNEPDYILQLIPYLENEGEKEGLSALYQALFALDLSPTQKEDALRMRAQYSIHQADWVTALKDLDNLLNLHEKWMYFQDRSLVKVQLKDIKGAVQDLTKAIGISSNSTILYSERGKLLAKAKAYDKAIADFEKILTLNALDRERADALFNIGVAYTKKQDKANALKSLMKAELMGHLKAKDFLLKNYADKLSQLRTKQRNKYKAAYEGAATRNSTSPILSKAIGQLWVPNMTKVFAELEPEMDRMPATIIKGVLEKASKDLFILTADALLLIEGDKEPVDAYYKVLVESEHSILLDVQPSKGGPSTNMRLSFFEGDLLMAYPDKEGGGSNDWKYLKNSEKATEDQKSRLMTKKINLPYAETIEASIAEIAG